MNDKKVTAVRNALLEGKHLTSLSAYELCKTTRLAAIIFWLRKKGMPIVTEMKENCNGEKYGEYFLGEEI